MCKRCVGMSIDDPARPKHGVVPADTERSRYERWHGRLRQVLGVPKCCVSCGSTKNVEWALREEFHVQGATVFVEDPAAYEALCHRCHLQRDLTGGVRSIATRARNRAAALLRSRNEDGTFS